ncbi:MAG: hypothetical protein JO167_14205 [Alphaproteobacteria bacterium]|nr:hypothetical protein [Alphaproteobacteria bacterium]
MGEGPPPYQQGKHRYRSVAEGMAMAQAYLRSGQGMSQFARENGITQRMVMYWSTRARQLASASETATAQPVSPPLLEHVGSVDERGCITTPEAAPAAPKKEAAIEVRLSNGARIAVKAGFSPARLRQVIACLEGGGAC